MASPSASVTSVETGILKGQVYDAKGGNAPEGTVVTLTSLDPVRPYTASVPTSGGSYVANSVPVDVQLQVSSTKPGWTTRTRVLVLRKPDQRLPNRNVYNFGGPTSTDDPAGSAFFISDYPEIERVEPVDQDSSLPNNKMQFKIVVSEPLDLSNQRRLASAMLIIPNNQEAIAEDTAVPDETSSAAPQPDDIASNLELKGLRGGLNPLVNSAYRYRQNAGFLNGVTVSTFKWEPDGRTATLTLDAPVKTSYKGEGEYAFLLIHQDDQKITDMTGLALGMDGKGKWGSYLKGSVIYSAMKRAGLVLAASSGGTDEQRWRETHQSWTKFSVARDSVAPKLVSILARRNYVDDTGIANDRVEFTFSEPMVAFPNVQSPSLLSLNNYSLTAAATEADLAGRSLNGAAKVVSVQPTSDFVAVRDAIKGQTGMVPDSNKAAAGNFLVKLSVIDPKVVIMQMPAGSLPLDANFVKGFAGTDTNASTGTGKTITDPAGNAMDTAANTAVGPIN